MFYILDVLIYIFYTAYKNTMYESPGLHTGQSFFVLWFTVSVPSGMFINYLLVDNWSFYKELLDGNILTSVVLFVGYEYLTYRTLNRRYTDKKILGVEAKFGNLLSVSVARFLFFVYGVFFVGAVVGLMVCLAGAFAKIV